METYTNLIINAACKLNVDATVLAECVQHSLFYWNHGSINHDVDIARKYVPFPRGKSGAVACTVFNILQPMFHVWGDGRCKVKDGMEREVSDLWGAIVDMQFPFQ